MAAIGGALRQRARMARMLCIDGYDSTAATIRKSCHNARDSLRTQLQAAMMAAVMAAVMAG